jgi:hypothetical protein
VSAILVYWGGSTTSIAEIGPSVDRETLQDTGNGQLGFTRLIAVDDSAGVAQMASESEGPTPPIEHQGVYWYRGRWFAFRFAH